MISYPFKTIRRYSAHKSVLKRISPYVVFSYNIESILVLCVLAVPQLALTVPFTALKNAKTFIYFSSFWSFIYKISAFHLQL